MASTCRRHLDGSIDHSKPSNRGMEEYTVAESSTELSASAYACVPHVSPALSVEETGLMAYLQAPPEAGPSIMQVTSGLQNWKCAGRRLVEIGGRLPTATQLHQSFIKILSKHLAANKKVNFVFQQQSSTIPMMNPSPTEIVELFSFVEASLIQCATVAGHFPGVAASSVKPKPKKANKVEVASDEPIKREAQVNADVEKWAMVLLLHSEPMVVLRCFEGGSSGHSSDQG